MFANKAALHGGEDVRGQQQPCLSGEGSRDYGNSECKWPIIRYFIQLKSKSQN